MVRCGDCAWGREITVEVRLGLGQENKEILNVLEAQRYRLSEFCYCERLGFIESRVMVRDCEDWEYKG
ncbi:MAG: hypothetical protein NWE89_13765 [Candidatus Bathyarchaeota archaeon]|nr:hypothetical protein [Candidatus Bathyarchaeota archaeon]